MTEPSPQLRELTYLLNKIPAGAHGAGDKTRARELLRREVETAMRPHLPAIEAVVRRRAQARRAAVAAGVEAGRRAGYAELARQQARRRIMNSRR